MTTYVYADDAAPLLPKGTMLKVTAWHDNTAAKKSNPDPNQWVGWGDRTVDEMAHAWINIVYMKDDDFKAEQERRKTDDGDDGRPPIGDSASRPGVSRRPDRIPPTPDAATASRRFAVLWRSHVNPSRGACVQVYLCRIMAR